MSAIIAQPPFRDARAKRFASIFRNAPESVLRSCIFAWHPRMGSYATLGPKYGYQRLGGTYSNPSGKYIYDRWAGVIRNFPAGVMPITGAQEPAVTNKVKNNRDLSESTWTQRGTMVATGGQLGPDGQNNATLLAGVDTAGNGDVYETDYSTVSKFGNDATISVGVWVKRVSTSGTVEIQNAMGDTLGRWTVDLSALPDRWVRLTKNSAYVTVVHDFVANASGQAGLLIACSAGGPTSFYVDLLQAQENAFVTSDIVCTSSYVARSADAFRFTNSGLLNGLAGEGSLLLAFKAPYASTVPTTAPWLAALNGDSGADLAGFFTKDSDDKLYAQLVLGGIDAGAVALSTYSANTWYAAAMAWNASDLRAAINGTGGTPYGATDVPSVLSGLEIGAVGSASARQGADYALVACFDRALQQAELNALTYNPERYVGQAA